MRDASLAPRPERAPDDLHVIGRWLDTRARLTPQRAAIEFDGEVLTYRDLADRSRDLAARLLATGLVPGDRVVTLTENHAEHVVLLFACAKSGLILAPLNWHLAGPELDQQIKLFTPALVVVSREQSARFVNRFAVRTLELESLADELDSTSATLPHVRDSDPLLLIATSGTTGHPKGAVLTHANCFWTNLGLDLSLPLTEDDVVLQVLPQYHVGGWNVQPLQAWWKGATVVLERSFEARRVLDLIATRRVTTMMGVPTNYLLLSQASGFESADLASLRAIVVGGAAMPCSLADLWRERGVDVVQGYGLTEASPNVCCLGAQDAKVRPGSVGKPYAYVEVALRDVATGEVVVGAGRGQMFVRGPNVFAGYWQNPTATADVLREGWLATGDVAERDSEGFYRISGRTKEMFISGGENVYPVEVERVLTSLADVVDAAVVGVDNARWGETGVAFVVVRPGASLTTEDLLVHCRRELAGFKVPSEILLLDELPRTHIGKVDKSRLSAMARSDG